MHNVPRRPARCSSLPPGATVDLILDVSGFFK